MTENPSPNEPVQFGRFQLLRRIGAGGMGEVFLARESGLHGPRACVVKKVLPNLVENRVFIGRFLDESKVVVRLKHANIARVYAMGEVKGEYYLAMEYVQGKTLARFTRRLKELGRELPLGLVLLIGERVCQGLTYAHEAKDEAGAPLELVHRDLSPANVCVSYRGEVKIIDFGAAQSTLKEEQTAPRVVIGNLTYMAPEQAKKQPVDKRADVYSAGVVLWELLAWKLLPQKGDPVERWKRAAQPSWQAPSTVRSKLPPDVDQTVLRALSTDPSARFRDATAFGVELRRLLGKYAPETSERELGALLKEVFAAEKKAEDEVLREALEVDNSIASGPTPKEARVFPPTALAFEHTAIVAAEDILPEEPEEQTDPEGTPTPAWTPERKRSASFASTRLAFGTGVDLPSLKDGLAEELEATLADDEPEVSGTNTSAYDTARRWRKWGLGAVLFALANAAGFLAVWWLQRPSR